MKALDTVQRSVNITKTQICVDSVQDGEPSGFLYNPYMPERIAFFGYLSLINVMDRFFDRMQCPQEMIKLMDNALAESSGSDTVDWE